MPNQTSNASAPVLQSRRSLFGMAAAGGIAAVLPGCTTPQRGPAVPMERTTQASVLGVPNKRFFPLYGAKPLEAEFQLTERRQRQTLGLARDAPLPAVQFLAVSGGGENG